MLVEDDAIFKKLKNEADGWIAKRKDSGKKTSAVRSIGDRGGDVVVRKKTSKT